MKKKKVLLLLRFAAFELSERIIKVKGNKRIFAPSF